MSVLSSALSTMSRISKQLATFDLCSFLVNKLVTDFTTKLTPYGRVSWWRVLFLRTRDAIIELLLSITVFTNMLEFAGPNKVLLVFVDVSLLQISVGSFHGCSRIEAAVSEDRCAPHKTSLHPSHSNFVSKTFFSCALLPLPTPSLTSTEGLWLQYLKECPQFPTEETVPLKRVPCLAFYSQVKAQVSVASPEGFLLRFNHFHVCRIDD